MIKPPIIIPHFCKREPSHWEAIVDNHNDYEEIISSGIVNVLAKMCSGGVKYVDGVGLVDFFEGRIKFVW